MIARSDLKKLARARLKDAQILLAGKRYDGAVYVCGYAIELALKARICALLKWSGYPDTRGEFANLTSFRTHDLAVLLRLSGRADRIRTKHLIDWSVVAEWDSESRYRVIGTAKQKDAAIMIESSTSLIRVL